MTKKEFNDGLEKHIKEQKEKIKGSILYSSEMTPSEKHALNLFFHLQYYRKVMETLLTD